MEEDVLVCSKPGGTVCCAGGVEDQTTLEVMEVSQVALLHWQGGGYQVLIAVLVD